jgi:hypothetical protein
MNKKYLWVITSAISVAQITGIMADSICRQGELQAEELVSKKEMCSLIQDLAAPSQRFALYGGAEGNQLFQNTSRAMPEWVAHNIRAGQSLDELLTGAATIRCDIANKTGTSKSERFRQRRKDTVGVAAAITPIVLYPFMQSVLLNNLIELPDSKNFIRISEEIEVRMRRMTVLEWFNTWPVEHNELNQLGAAIFRMIKGGEGKGERGLYLYNLQTGEENHHYVDSLEKAVVLAKLSQDVPHIKIGHLEFRFKGTQIPTRSFMFAWDDDFSHQDYSNVPFLIIHPTIQSLRFHWAWAEKAFEEARYANGSDEEKYKAIATFMYRWALTMPLVRGSAAVGEWLVGGLYLHLGLKPPAAPIISYFDQLAHGSFSCEKFVEVYMQLVRSQNLL